MNKVYQKDNLRDKRGNELQDFKKRYIKLQNSKLSQCKGKLQEQFRLIDHNLTIQIDKS